MLVVEASNSDCDISQRRGWVLTLDCEFEESLLSDLAVFLNAPAFAAFVPLLEFDRDAFSAFLLVRPVFFNSFCEPFFDSCTEFFWLVRAVLTTVIDCTCPPLLEFRLERVDLSCSARDCFSF